MSSSFKSNPTITYNAKINFIDFLLLTELSLLSGMAFIQSTSEYNTNIEPHLTYCTTSPTTTTQTLCSKHFVPVILLSDILPLLDFHLLHSLPKGLYVLVNFYSSFKSQIKFHFLQTSLIHPSQSNDFLLWPPTAFYKHLHFSIDSSFFIR